uniref:Uncharacterized protein n=1 Tax=Arundo donax TaxID=35708 RepID=A0A0A9BPC2_ARUDO
MLDNHVHKISAAKFLIKVCSLVVMVLARGVAITRPPISGRFVLENTAHNKLPALTSTACGGGGADCEVVAQVCGARPASCCELLLAVVTDSYTVAIGTALLREVLPNCRTQFACPGIVNRGHRHHCIGH